MEEIVSRSHLASWQDSAPSSPVSITLDDLQTAQQLDFVQYHQPEQEVQQAQANDDELEFRLFAAPSKQQNGTIPSIRIRSESPVRGDPGFLQPGRPDCYYFTGAESKDVSSRDAVSDDDVQHLASIRWHGMAYPWKTLRLPLSSEQTDRTWSKLIGLGQTSNSTRRRPGKKLRIKLRIKLRAAETARLEAQAAQEARDAVFQEKKTRKNREKKTKKRQRDKLKMVAEEHANADNKATIQDDTDTQMVESRTTD